MQQPFLPYGRQSITEQDIEAVVEVLKSSYLTQGPVIQSFEEAILKKVRCRYAVAVNSATSALHIACLALGLGPGDRLWTSPITFVASANCGRYCGAIVDFVDIDPLTGLMSIQALSEKLKHAELNGTLPKIVIPVHLAGSSCDMQKIRTLSDHYGFTILEDASHAIGGNYKGEPVGSCSYSDITIFSFHPVKIITTGEGGVATTNDPLLARSMSELRSHGIVRDPDQFTLPQSGLWAYEQQVLGFNYRITDIQCALGLSQLDRLDQIVKTRNHIFNVYKQMLADMPVQLLEIPDGVLSSVHLAVIRLCGFSPNQHRLIFEGFRNSGIGVQLHYSPVHLQPYYRSLGFSEGDYPESEIYGSSAISLPLFPLMTELDQTRVLTVLRRQLQVHRRGEIQ